MLTLSHWRLPAHPHVREDDHQGSRCRSHLRPAHPHVREDDLNPEPA